jgi:peptidoglycan/LPS O-acetylase OafA/YrhL
MKRNPTLDALRGAAALLVFAAHAGGAYDSRIYSAMKNTFDLGQLGVVIFFLISGWIIPQSIAQGNRVFWLRRILRLYPLYWVSIFMLGGTLHAMLINLTMLQGLFGVPHINPGAWTLVIELAFYIAVTVIRAPPARIAMLCAIGQVATDLIMPLWDFSCLGYLSLIYCGSVLREKRDLIAVVCVVIVACAPRTLLIEPADTWARLVGFGVFWLAMRYSFAPRALVWAGERSYSLYLMHPIAMGLLPVILWLPGAISLSILTYVGIEKPAMAFARLLKPTSMPAPASAETTVRQ